MCYISSELATLGRRMDVQLAVSAFSAAIEAGKALVGARDSAKAQEHLIEFNNAIIEAQSLLNSALAENAALTSEVNELKQECVRLQAWDADKERYTLTEITPGAFVYLDGEASGPLENSHKLCCNCFEQKRKATLQQFRIEQGWKYGLKCPNNCPDIVFTHYKDQE